MMETSFFVGRVKLVPRRGSRFGALRVRLFETMHRNALPATEFFRIPPDRVIELGGQVATVRSGRRPTANAWRRPAWTRSARRVDQSPASVHAVDGAGHKQSHGARFQG
jgi:hypothetical protein